MERGIFIDSDGMVATAIADRGIVVLPLWPSLFRDEQEHMAKVITHLNTTRKLEINAIRMPEVTRTKAVAFFESAMESK